jgi:hypothetical protein
MGSIITARCDCGYGEEMYLGGGMLDFTTRCTFPLFCANCKILFKGNLFEKRIVCPECKSEGAIPYDNDQLCHRRGQKVFDWRLEREIGRDPELTDGEYMCPKCGQFTMTFEDVGCWD